MAIPARVTKHLETLKLKHAVVPHRTVFTVYDLAQTLKVKLNTIAKSLLVKTDLGLAIVVVPAHKRLDFTAVKKALGAKKVELASEKDMVKKLKVKPGALTAFGTLHKLPLVVDRGLAKTEQLLFSAGSFTESLRLKVKPYLKTQDPTIAPIAKSGS